MIHDTLDLLNPRGKYTCAGTFYAVHPDRCDEPKPFNYEYVNAYSAQWRRLFANIEGVAGEVTVRTNDNLGYVPNKTYIRLQDGKLYSVLQVQADYQTTSPQVLRLFSAPISVEYVLQLHLQDDPWGMQ